MKINSERRGNNREAQKITDFKLKLQQTMPFWPRNVLEKNENDKTFLLSMAKASMAGEDIIFKKKSKKIVERTSLTKARAMQETQRKDNSFEIAQLASSTDGESTDNDVPSTSNINEFSSASSQPNSKSHHRTIKTGTTIYIPYDILKSEKITSTAVRNKISHTVLSAVLRFFVFR